jgi:hypothetical protein
MIKYAEIPEFQATGETEFGSHLYTFREKEKQEPQIVLIRAYDVEPVLWCGLLFNSTKKIVNMPKRELDLTDVNNILGSVKRVDSFKEFIKGHSYESQFKDYEETTSEEEE